MTDATLLTGDLHLNEHPLDRYRHDFMCKTLPDLIDKHFVSHLIILGDITDEKDRHPARLVNRIVDELHELAKLCDLTILKGNHDGADEQWPFFRFIRRMPHCHWVNSPRVIGEDLFLPHTHHWKKEWCRNSYSDIRRIYTHMTFSGARGENDMTLDGAPTDIFPPGIRVFSGDVHVPQTLGPLTYVGAPYRIKFGDAFDPRVLLLCNGKEVSIKVPGPRKQLLHFEWPNLPPRPDYAVGDAIKIRVDLKPKYRASTAEIKQELRQYCKDHEYQLHSMHFLLMHETRMTTEGTTRTDRELMRDYATAKNLDDKTLQVGLDLLNK